MDKGFAVLEIDPEFKTLIRPLRKDEYLQLAQHQWVQPV